MLLGIVGTTLLGVAAGLVKWSPESYSIADIAATAGKLDVRAACTLDYWKSFSCFYSLTCSITLER